MKWAWADVPLGSQCRGYLGRVTGAKANMGQHIPGHSAWGHPSWVAGAEAGMIQEVPGNSALAAP